MKTLEDEWYVVIKAYKLAVFEILGDFFVLPYIACPRYPYTLESTDSMIERREIPQQTRLCGARSRSPK